MPTYDYHCSTCDLGFELFQSFSEDTLSRCPTKKSGNSPQGCINPGKGKVAKVFSAPGISFKGSGFYKNDSRSDSSPSRSSKSESKADSKSDSSSSKSTSDSKSDSKTSEKTSSSSSGSESSSSSSSSGSADKA